MKTVTITIKMSTWSIKTRSAATTKITNINFNAEVAESVGKGDIQLAIQERLHIGIIVK